MSGEWEIVMPRLSDTMTEGLVSRWLRVVGDRVEKGEALVEIETEKATLEIESEADGFLVEIRAADGSEVPTGGRLGLVAPEFHEAVESSATSNPAGSDAAEQPRAVHMPPPATQTAVPSEDVGVVEEDENGRIRVSPVARKLARELGVDLAAIGVGRGPMGRIIRTDVERAARSASLAETPGGATRTVSRRHAAMARRMIAAKQAIPHFYLSVEVDMTPLQQLRDDLKRASEPKPISVTAFVVKACALALRKIPAINSSWQEDGIRANESVNVGIAVALENGELVVPVLTEADLKTPNEIQAELSQLSEKARGLELKEADLQGGTFTVSNMGMLGVDAAYAIINPPESGILAVGSVRQTLALVDGEIVTGRAMTVGLSGDHRVYSGATGAEFLRYFREYLGNPATLFRDPGDL